MNTQLTTKDILFRVNELRAREGKPVIPSWKGKKEALLSMLEELTAKMSPKLRKNGELATYCREHNLNAKTIRQKLRDRNMPRNMEGLRQLMGVNQ